MLATPARPACWPRITGNQLMTTFAPAVVEVKFHTESDVFNLFPAQFDAWLAGEAEDAEYDRWMDRNADLLAARHADDELTSRIADGSMPW